MPILSSHKTCSKCGAYKPLGDFHRQRTGPNLRHSWCKDCYNANAREHRNRKVTPEQRLTNNLWTRYRLLRSDEAVAQYIAGEAEMGVTAWLRAIKAWPDLEDRLTYHLMDEDEKAFRANQRALNLPPPQPQSEAA